MSKNSANKHYSKYETYLSIGKDGLFELLNGLINKTNELYNNGIEDLGCYNDIKLIIKVLIEKYEVDIFQIKKIQYINYLIEKYELLDNAWDKADDTGGHGKDKLSYEMGEITKELNKMGLNYKGDPLKSLGIVDSIKKSVQSQLNI